MARPNRQIEVPSSIFEVISANVAEAIHLITEGKKDDRLSVEEAQAIKVLCDLCINGYHYLDHVARRNEHPEGVPSKPDSEAR